MYGHSCRVVGRGGVGPLRFGGASLCWGRSVTTHTLVERSRSDALRARCVFCNIPFLHVPTWEAARATFQRAPSGAHMWNRRSLVSSHCV